MVKNTLKGVELTEEEIVAGLKARCLAMEITPMTCGTAFKNKGSSNFIRCSCYVFTSSN